MKNLPEVISRVSGLNVVEADRALTRDAMEGSPRGPANESPVVEEDLTPAACRNGVSVSSESIKAGEDKPMRWHSSA